MRTGWIAMTCLLSGKVSIRRGKMNYERKRSGSRSQQTKWCKSYSLTTGAFFISILCHHKWPSTSNITSKSWRSSSSMLMENTWNWRTGISFTRMMCVYILCNWCKNTSKTLMLYFHLIHCTHQILPRLSFDCFQPFKEASLWSLIRVKRGNRQSPHIFQSLPQTEFVSTIKVKWAEITEHAITNKGQYFDKVWTQKTNCESEDSDKYNFFLVFLFAKGHCYYSLARFTLELR